MPAYIQELREMLARERGVLLPGAPNALAARVTPLSRSACFSIPSAPRTRLSTGRGLRLVRCGI
jgi:hypothetical protein